jgi:hypothetical protein
MQPNNTSTMISKGIMETSLELIRVKITELETKIFDLRIAERELVALDRRPVQQTKAAPKLISKAGPKPKPTARISKPVEKVQTEKAQTEKTQTMGAAVAQVLAEHDPLSVAEIAGFITATGRDIGNRAISFTLQAMKKRGLVKSVDGKWTVSKTRSK